MRKTKKKKPQIEENRDAKPRRRKRVGAKREKCDALDIKAKQSKYSDVMKAKRSSWIWKPTDVRSIRRTRTDGMILELKRDKERRGAAYKSLVKKILGEGLEMRALTAEATLKVINLDKITEAEELITALRQQCDRDGRDTARLGSATCGGCKKSP